METQSRVFKVIVAFQEKDEVFYTRIKSTNGVPVSSLMNIICLRYPSLSNLIKRCYVIDKSGSEFSIINNDDLCVFLEAEELFENIVRVEINGVERRNGEIASPPKRVRIEEQQATPSAQTSDEDKAVHSEVVCDCCDQLIIGFRYKCTECYNFDLCMTCEGKMRHREHVMLRIPKPVENPLSLAFLTWKNDLARNCGRKHQETAQANVDHDKSRRQHGHHGKRHHRRHHRHGVNLFDGFFRQLNEDSPASDVENVPQTHSTSTSAPQPQTQPQASQPTPQAVPPAYDFHKLVKVVEAVAGNVSKLFDPLGVNLDSFAEYGVNVPPSTAGTATSPPSAPGPEKPSSPTKESVPAKPELAPEKEKQTQANQVAHMEGTKENSPEPTIIDVVEDSSNQSAIIQPTTDTTPMSPNTPSNHSDDAEWLVISNEGLPDDEKSSDQDKSTQVSPRKESVMSTSVQTSNVTSAETSAQTQGYDELALRLQKDIEAELRSSASTSNNAGVSASSVPNVPIVYHPAPHINASIHKMMDMGFSNDGGCLTELMACCNGDIRRALDSLLYKK